jgi:hypothetical protein
MEIQLEDTGDITTHVQSSYLAEVAAHDHHLAAEQQSGFCMRSRSSVSTAWKLKRWDMGASSQTMSCAMRKQLCQVSLHADVAGALLRDVQRQLEPVVGGGAAAPSGPRKPPPALRATGSVSRRAAPRTGTSCRSRRRRQDVSHF